MFQGLGLQPDRKWDGSLSAKLGSTQEELLPSLAQPTLMPLVAMAHPKNSQDGHVPAPRLLGTPRSYSPSSSERFCGFRELQDPILEAGPGPEGGKGGTFKVHKM